MRVLVVADDAGRRRSLAAMTSDAGHEVCAAADAAGAAAAVIRASEAPPQALLAETAAGGMALRRLVTRVRLAAEAELPVVLLLPEASTWLRGGLPLDLLPAVAARGREAGAVSLRRALAEIGDGGGRAGAAAAVEVSAVSGGLAYDAVARQARGPGGVARLTQSEGAILGALVAEPGAVVGAERVAQALWGSATVDRHSRAAIRSHVYTLRTKLRGAGLDGVVVSVPGVGYRLETDLRDGRG